jgi:hypothetical protein
MIINILISVVAVVGMIVVWTFVQMRWKSVFQDEYEQEDALKGRSSCSNCGCTQICENKKKLIGIEE